MSEHLFVPAVATSRPASAPARERRRNQRVVVALQVRVRPLDPRDGNFEEVRTTLNASQKSLYFSTTLDRYYKGMLLRITPPNGSLAASGDWQEVGEVVRVHRRDDGFGVAVVLASASHLAAPSQPHANPPQQGNSRDAERRGDRRSPFIAPAQLIDIRGGVWMQARTSDLSVHGCYLDTLNPLPVGTKVRLRIQNSNEILDVLARVTSQHAGSGMGLVFPDITPQQRSMVENWFWEALVPPEAPSMGSFRARKKQRPAEGDQACVVRLIHALVRKGLLSQSDASALLSDPDL